jgi:hypothetical protein
MDVIGHPADRQEDSPLATDDAAHVSIEVVPEILPDQGRPVFRRETRW